MRLTPTVIFVHLKVRLIIIVWVVGLLLLVHLILIAELILRLERKIVSDDIINLNY